MGAALTRTLSRVLPDTSEGSVWVKNKRGPQLRRLFGAYLNPDLWSIYRRVRVADSDGNGYLSYDELANLLPLPDFHLMYLWDLFSHQDELINARELLTAISVFSSAALQEKGRFLMTVFDSAQTGMVTGADIANACLAVVNVLGRCTGQVVKAKDVSGPLREELPQLLPEYREVLKKHGGHRAAAEQSFNTERIITPDQLDKLLPAVQSLYQDLPVAGPKPDDAMPSPPADWGENPMVAAAQKVQQSSPEEAPPSPASAAEVVPAGAGPSAVRALVASRSAGAGGGLPLMTEQRYAQHVDETERLAEQLAMRQAQQETEDLVKAQRIAVSKQALPPAQGTMLIHGADFYEVEKEMTRFQYLFCKGLSGAVGIPSGCIEILSIQVSSVGSVIVHFRVHASRRPGDDRNGAQMLDTLAEQMLMSTSPLRRGVFRDYLASAELRKEAEGSRPCSRGERRPVRCDAAVQATDTELMLEEVERLLELERLRYEAAQAKLDALRGTAAAPEAPPAPTARPPEAAPPEEAAPPRETVPGEAAAPQEAAEKEEAEPPAPEAEAPPALEAAPVATSVSADDAAAAGLEAGEKEEAQPPPAEGEKQEEATAPLLFYRSDLHALGPDLGLGLHFF